MLEGGPNPLRLQLGIARINRIALDNVHAHQTQRHAAANIDAALDKIPGNGDVRALGEIA